MNETTKPLMWLAAVVSALTVVLALTGSCLGGMIAEIRMERSEPVLPYYAIVFWDVAFSVYETGVHVAPPHVMDNLKTEWADDKGEIQVFLGGELDVFRIENFWAPDVCEVPFECPDPRTTLTAYVDSFTNVHFDSMEILAMPYGIDISVHGSIPEPSTWTMSCCLFVLGSMVLAYQHYGLRRKL